MKYGNIFWGVILITLGILIALRNMDVFFFSWSSIFRLWPLIFVFWGIALLPIKSMVKLLLTVGTVLIGLLILVNNPGRSFHFFQIWPHSYSIESDSDDEESWSEQYFDEDFEGSFENATLNIDAAAGEFSLRGVTSKLFEFETKGNTGLYSAKTRKVDENNVVVDFTHEQYKGRRHIENKVWMHINDGPVWEMNIDVGAAEIDMDLSNFKVKRIDIDGGASSIKLKLGDQIDKTIVNIDAGASGIKIKIPFESACEIHTNTILTGRSFDDFNKIENGLYQTPNFSDSANQIFIDVDAAISGVKVERY
ncbi:MAG: cell wall-active antibiotics response protein [Bacteroidales bacterium]|nr:cell wall-active antibiotics response protein [Bacteroidales bacterium]MCF8403209.1 cell wall-active antibiotics response protein [Bacteroidales bacterium]